MHTLPPLSRAFARFIAQQSGQAIDAIVPRTAAWLSLSNQQGHVCLNMAEKSNQPWFDTPDGEVFAPLLAAWKQALQENICITEPTGYAPMVLCGDLLYLHRFYTDESRLVDAIASRLKTPISFDPQTLHDALLRIFDTQLTGEQAQAVALAASSSFTVISGAPGTGKTTSLVKLLAVLLMQQPTMHIRLAAPTGKAAARMMEAIGEKRGDLHVDASVGALIPTEACTIHRLLGFDGRSYRYHVDHLLSLDCLIIDEASMIDLPLMARIVDALPRHARLILLGDRDQLASVEAGSVLGDMTGHGTTINHSKTTHDWLTALAQGKPRKRMDTIPPIGDAIALLTTSYRFSLGSGIACLAAATNAGDATAACTCFEQFSSGIAWQHETSDLIAQAAKHFAECYSPTAAETLHALASFRVLCAIKKGSYGVAGINHRIAASLRAQGLVQGVHGMLMMITVNHAGLGLFNGDVGLIWRDDASGDMQAHFHQLDGGIRILPLLSLPAYIPAWAITVHKAQGSEFNRVVLVLPDDTENPLLGRELLYTAITRARQHFMLYATPAVLTAMVERKLQRSSGLAARLGWQAEAYAKDNR